MKKWTEITIIALLVLSIVLNVANLVTKTSGDASLPSVEKTIEASNAWRDYMREIGQKYLQVIDDKVSTSSYNSKSIVGKIANNADKAIEEIQIRFVFYKNNEIIGYASEYLEKLHANTSIDFDLYLYDSVENFDRYEIEYILGVIYE